MPDYVQPLTWIDTRRSTMLDRLVRWSGINSYSLNRGGLANMLDQLETAFEPLEADVRRITLADYQTVNDCGELAAMPLGQALHLSKRPDAPRQILLVIHYDTVYPPDHPFQAAHRVDENTLRGPGVADAKGGILVMLTALQALERSEQVSDLGWQVILNPDEEIGSPGSLPLLQEAARQCQVGLVYEPALPDGTLVGPRKGSGYLTIVVRGKAAHVGRNFDQGRSAIHAMAELVVAMDRISTQMPDAIVNVGCIQGGGPANMVSELAIGRLNIRVNSPAQWRAIEAEIHAQLDGLNQREGFQAELHGGLTAPPKAMDAATSRLFQHIVDCGRVLGMSLTSKSSGGVCDGNRLAAVGLPVIDTLGPRGGNLHSDEEYVVVSSLTRRAKLSALLLMRYATGELPLPQIAHASR